jgi:probable O-glycosylation ligase (exosortase A-associated)
MRPDILAFSTRAWYSPALAVASLMGALGLAGTIPWRSLVRNRICLWLLLLQVPILASVLGAVDPALSEEPYSRYGRMIVVVMLIPLVIRTLPQLRTMMLVISVSLGGLGVRFGLYGLMHGGIRFTQGYGGMMSGNNEVGMAFAMIVPFCYYARKLVSSWWLKQGFLVMTFATTAALVMTYSRGAALGLAAVFMTIVLRSKHKAGMLVLIVLLTAPTVYLMQDSYLSRMATMQAPEEEASAMSRIEFAKAALDMWREYPLLGVGFGQQNYVALSAGFGGDGNHVVHNTYLQVLVDSGIFAFSIYIGLLLGTLVWLGFSARQARRQNPELEVYPIVLQASLIAFAVSATFGSREGFDFYYILLMCAASWGVVQRAMASEPVHEADPARRPEGVPEVEATTEA